MDVLQGSIGGAVGARAIAGGRADEADLYIEPTILAGVSWESAIMQDEIFGPLLPVLPYDSLEQAEGALLRRPKPLALYVFSRDLAQARALLRRLPAGGSCVNNAIIHLANPRLPFGGVGASGFGSYHGHAGFRAFSHERSVLLQRRWGVSGLGLMEPPHGKRGRRALEAAIHWAGRHFG
jgi:aldehyde dehydrogenase (NAD+)